MLFINKFICPCACFDKLCTERIPMSNVSGQICLCYSILLRFMQNWENHTWISFETGFIFLSIPKLHLRFCSVARRPPASEEGGKVALSQLPPFLGFEQKYFNGEFLEHWKIMCQFAEAVVSTSEEKKAPPCMERLQKEHCIKEEPVISQSVTG